MKNDKISHFKAKVIHGNKIGRQIGFPTANLAVLTTESLPDVGVYAVNVRIDQQTYQGMLNIGSRPTFDGTELSIEVHLFNFEQEIYDKEVDVEVIDFLRNEQKYDSIEKLINQLRKDKQLAVERLSKQK